MIPAKVFEYMGTGLPLIYVGDGASDAARLLAVHPRCHLVPPGDVEAARRALLMAAGEPSLACSLEPFTRRTLAGRLAGVLMGAAA
jgi:hypothetical protein